MAFTKLWTSEEIYQATTLHKGGYHTESIGALINRSPIAVERKLERLGYIPLKNKYKRQKWTFNEIEIIIKLFKKGYSPEHISTQINRSPKAIEQKLRRLEYKKGKKKRIAKKWTKKEFQKAKKLRLRGNTYREIANKMGRSYNNVYTALNLQFDGETEETLIRGYKKPPINAQSKIRVKADPNNLIRIPLYDYLDAKIQNQAIVYDGLPVGVDKDDIDLAIEYGEWRLL